jgi:hypothetical protein
MHFEGVRVAAALRVQVQVKRVAREPAVDHLHAADLDDAMALVGVQAVVVSVSKKIWRITRPAPLPGRTMPTALHRR